MWIPELHGGPALKFPGLDVQLLRPGLKRGGSPGPSAGSEAGSVRPAETGVQFQVQAVQQGKCAGIAARYQGRTVIHGPATRTVSSCSQSSILRLSPIKGNQAENKNPERNENKP